MFFNNAKRDEICIIGTKNAKISDKNRIIIIYPIDLVLKIYNLVLKNLAFLYIFSKRDMFPMSVRLRHFCDIE